MNFKFCRDACSLLFLSLFFLQTSAQYKPLKIGDALPDEVWSAVHQSVNTKQETTTLASDKDKLILLDFWATWCGSCLKNFPHMEELQQKFGDQLKIVPITKEDRSVLAKFYQSKNGQRFTSYPSVVEDKLFYQLFTPRALPYIVWLKDGKVLNTTDAFQVTEQTVSEILNNKTSSLQTVIQADPAKPLMLSENFEFEKASTLRNYALLAKGRIRAMVPSSHFHRKENVVYGRRFANMSLIQIFSAIAYEVMDKKKEPFYEKQIINLVKNKSEIDFTDTVESKQMDEKLYSFEFIAPLENTSTLYEDMLAYLSKYSGYNAMFEKQMRKCLILKRVSKDEKFISKGGESIDNFNKKEAMVQNVSLKNVLSSLNANSSYTDLLVLDETGITKNVDLHLGTIQNLQALRKSLQKYGLDLVEGERSVQMLVITENKKS